MSLSLAYFMCPLYYIMAFLFGISASLFTTPLTGFLARARLLESPEKKYVLLLDDLHIPKKPITEDQVKLVIKELAALAKQEKVLLSIELPAQQQLALFKEIYDTIATTNYTYPQKLEKTHLKELLRETKQVVNTYKRQGLLEEQFLYQLYRAAQEISTITSITSDQRTFITKLGDFLVLLVLLPYFPQEAGAQYLQSRCKELSLTVKELTDILTKTAQTLTKSVHTLLKHSTSSTNKKVISSLLQATQRFTHTAQLFHQEWYQDKDKNMCTTILERTTTHARNYPLNSNNFSTIYTSVLGETFLTIHGEILGRDFLDWAYDLYILELIITQKNRFFINVAGMAHGDLITNFLTRENYKLLFDTRIHLTNGKTVSAFSALFDEIDYSTALQYSHDNLHQEELVKILFEKSVLPLSSQTAQEFFKKVANLPDLA